MKKFNLFNEPIRKFETDKPEKLTLISVHWPGDPDYEEINKKMEQHPESVIQLVSPYDFLWCLNIKRRGEFALRKWIEQQPNPHDILRLLDNIMLVQDYIFETNSMSTGRAVKEQNERIDLIQKSLERLIKKQGLKTDDLWLENAEPAESLTEVQALHLFAKAWNTLDPGELILHLAENIEYSSQNVLESMTTVEEVSEYLNGKMETIRNHPENPVFAEMGETQQYPMYPNPPRPCVLMAQSDPNDILAIVLIEVSSNKITKIDICSVAPEPHTAKRSGEYPK